MDAGNNNSVVSSYVYANSQPLAKYNGEQEQANDKHFYLHDRLGSVRLLIDESGDVENVYTYQPYGELIATESTETTENPFKFTGQWYDDEIDQYYLRARQYDPETMRFTARDPVKGRFKEPLTLHVYLYCANDPLNRTDLDGMLYEEIELPYIITIDKLDEVMEACYLEKLKGKVILTKYAWSHLDTAFWNEDADKEHLFKPFDKLEWYMKATSEELNYVGVGMGMRHMVHPIVSPLALTLAWNWGFSKDAPHVPSLNEITFAFWGYMSYDRISGKHKSFGERLLHDMIWRALTGL